MAELSVQAADGTRRVIPVTKDRIRIGRSRDNDVFLPDQWLSRVHAEIRSRDDAFFLADMESKNGTLLNGARLLGEQRLRPGDVITLGEHVLTFVEDDGDDYDDAEPVGTQVFSAVELSAVAERPVADPAELVKRNRLLTVLIGAANGLIEHRPLDELFETILDLILEAVPAERAALLLVEGDPPKAVVTASRSRRGEKITRISRSIARRVLEQRVSILLPNILEDVSLKSQDSILSSGIRSALCAPLWYKSADGGRDAVIGLVYLDTLRRTQPFTEEDLQILTAVGNIAAGKIENVRLLEQSLEMRRLEEDMRIAAEIQTGLLPSGAPEVEGYGLVGSNRPSRSIGGDYYDFAVEDDELLLALGDVSGKGTGAALLMTVLRASVRAHWTEPSPSQAVGRINNTVEQNTPQGKFITFFGARLEPKTGQLKYVNAGHNPPMLLRANGDLETLREGGMVLGLFEDVEFDEGTAELRSGDVLLIFSDGVTETWSADDEEFGEDRLIEIARKHCRQDAAEIQTAILKSLDEFGAPGKLSDDRTLIVLKRN
jgi:serine phosphatase RsbU (regulator of sigma subunit)/pSer/pThr/pTyr-binding forkhead associated (FHA) protein